MVGCDFRGRIITNFDALYSRGDAFSDYPPTPTLTYRTPEILSRRQFRRHLLFWTACMVISLSLIWTFYFYQIYALQAKTRTLAELKQKHRDLGSKINEIRRIQGELDRMRQQQAGLENITLGAPYSQIFAKLADIMNEATFITVTREGEAVGHLKSVTFD